jgi:hypothetical protein
MGVEGIDRRGAGVGSTRRARLAAIEHDACSSRLRAALPNGEIARDPGEVRLYASDSDTDQIKQAALRLPDDNLGKIIEGKIMDEAHHRLRHLSP